MRKSRLQRLELWVIALFLLCQGLQAVHFHVQPDRPTERSWQTATSITSDASCAVCWAHQALGSAVAPVTVHVVANPTLGLGPSASAIARTAPRGAFNPRAPPAA